MLEVWRFSSHAVRYQAYWPGSFWLSVLRQPAHANAAPKCHAPTPCRLPVLRRPARRHGIATACMHRAESLEIKSRERCSCSTASAIFGSAGSGISNAHPPATSLTGRSSGRQQGPRLRHCLGPCWCPSVAALLTAPLT